MNPHAQQFRERFLAAFEKTPPGAGLYLSGGADSLTNLAAALALGRRPLVVTFRLNSPGWDSADWRVVESVCGHFGLRRTYGEIKTENLVPDVRRVISEIGTTRKTHVQVAHAFLAMIPHSLPEMTWGMKAHWGLSRDVGVANAISPAHGVEAIKAHFNDPDFSGDRIRKWLAGYGINVSDPWADPDFNAFFLERTLAELHDGGEKAMAIDAFPEFWGAGPWRKKNANLQVDSGLRSLHDQLLNDRANLRGSKHVLGVYNDIAAGLRGDVAAPDQLSLGFEDNETNNEKTTQ